MIIKKGWNFWVPAFFVWCGIGGETSEGWVIF